MSLADLPGGESDAAASENGAGPPDVVLRGPADIRSSKVNTYCTFEALGVVARVDGTLRLCSAAAEDRASRSA